MIVEMTFITSKSLALISKEGRRDLDVLYYIWFRVMDLRGSEKGEVGFFKNGNLWGIDPLPPEKIREKGSPPLEKSGEEYPPPLDI